MIISMTEARLSQDATNANVRCDAVGRLADLGALFEVNAAAMYRTILAYTGGRSDLAEEAVAISIDAPAISVTPALVSPDGAEIYPYPLIPAPTGAQSREDVLEATRGLSEVARIERWDGSTWEVAGEIQLSKADDDLARSAELPPLPEGEYRLVREGPKGRHIGHFRVDGTISM
jgi:hypothetical protein